MKQTNKSKRMAMATNYIDFFYILFSLLDLRIIKCDDLLISFSNFAITMSFDPGFERFGLITGSVSDPDSLIRYPDSTFYV